MRALALRLKFATAVVLLSMSLPACMKHHYKKAAPDVPMTIGAKGEPDAQYLSACEQENHKSTWRQARAHLSEGSIDVEITRSYWSDCKTGGSTESYRGKLKPVLTNGLYLLNTSDDPFPRYIRAQVAEDEMRMTDLQRGIENAENERLEFTMRRLSPGDPDSEAKSSYRFRSVHGQKQAVYEKSTSN